MLVEATWVPVWGTGNVRMKCAVGWPEGFSTDMTFPWCDVPTQP